MDYPFKQKEKDGKLYRVFSPDVDTDELKWHQDMKNRKVKIVECGGWQLQMDNELPSKLSDGEKLYIPKLVWHRVIKGDKKLKIEIEEL